MAANLIYNVIYATELQVVFYKWEEKKVVLSFVSQPANSGLSPTFKKKNRQMQFGSPWYIFVQAKNVLPMKTSSLLSS